MNVKSGQSSMAEVARSCPSHASMCSDFRQAVFAAILALHLLRDNHKLCGLQMEQPNAARATGQCRTRWRCALGTLLTLSFGQTVGVVMANQVSQEPLAVRIGHRDLAWLSDLIQNIAHVTD